MPKSIAELKANIEREIKNISKDDLSRVFDNFKNRMELTREKIFIFCEYFNGHEFCTFLC